MTLRVSNAVLWDVIEQSTLENVGWEVEVYNRDNPGELLAVVPRWNSLSFSKVISDTGSGGLVMDMDDQAVFGLDTIRQHLVEDENIIKFIRNGIPRFAFLNEDADETHVSQDETKPFEPKGRGAAKLLEWATVLPPQYPTFTGLPWTWASAPAMKAWRDLKVVADSRGSAASKITLSFTDTADSAGQPWLDSNNISLDPGTDLLSLLKRFAEAGEAEWVVNPTDLVLDARKTLGFDRSTTCRFFISHTQLVSKMMRSRRAISNVVYTISANQQVPFVQDAESVLRWGRREILVETANAADSLTAQSFGRIILARNKDEVVSATVKVLADVPGTEVFVDYDVGDFVWIDSDVAGLEGSYRVVAISMEVDQEGREDLELTLSSALELRMVALQKQFERETGATLRVDSELQIGNQTGAREPQGLRDFSRSDIDLGDHAPSTAYTWYTITGVPERALIWRFRITSGGSLNWAIQVRSKDDGQGELMFEAVGIGATSYSCSWPWVFQNQDDPFAEKMYVGIKNISGAETAFTLVDMRGESLSK